MKKTYFLLGAILTLMLFNCKKEESNPSYFNPTNHAIRLLGDSMRFSITLPNYEAFYNFSADSTQLNSSGEGFYDLLVSTKEMEGLAKSLSDTLIFEWEVMTQMFPYPVDDCKLLVYSNSSGNYMCTIGKGTSASNVIQELSNSFTGEAKNILIEISVILKQ